MIEQKKLKEKKEKQQKKTVPQKKVVEESKDDRLARLAKEKAANP